MLQCDHSAANFLMHLPQLWQENQRCCFHCNSVKKTPQVIPLFVVVQWWGICRNRLKKWVLSTFPWDVVHQTTVILQEIS